MKWRRAWPTDSFRKGEMVLSNSDSAQALVVEDTPPGHQTVRVEIQRQRGAGNRWDYSNAGDLQDMPRDELMVQRDDE
jgi:hypothetical protein